jgi:hypothetical protein
MRRVLSAYFSNPKLDVKMSGFPLTPSSFRVFQGRLDTKDSTQMKNVFKHIKYFYDSDSKKTTVLCSLSQSIHPKLFEDFEKYRIEVVSQFIKGCSIPSQNLIKPYLKNEKLLWIQVDINNKINIFVKFQFILYKNNAVLGIKNVSVGYKFRENLKYFLKQFLDPTFDRLALFLKSNSKPVISLHLWHLDVAIDILKTYKKTSKYFELRLAIPDNLTPSILNQLNNHLEQKYHFSKVTTLKIPAVGRDIGGLISSLIYSMESFEYRGRPHLFLHTKNTPNIHPLLAWQWRKSLIDDISFGLASTISLFLFRFGRASIVYSLANDRFEDGQDDIDERKESYRLARALSRELFNESNEKMRFCAGTMMWVMPARVEKVWSVEKLQAVLSKLEPSPTMQEPSHAHAFERLFPDIVRRSGLKVFRI